MFDRVVLSRDLVDARGIVIGKRGLVVSVEMIAKAARRLAPSPQRVLSETPLAADLHLPLADPMHRHLFREQAVQADVARALLSVRLPGPIFDELLALREADPARYRHALATAAVAVRMLLAAVGAAPALPDQAAAGLLHDLGMRYLPQSLLQQADPLDPREALDVAGHPLLGAWYLAVVLGAHPAVEAALTHHWRNGHGYPTLTRPPTRSAQVVGVASAFTALTQARVYRSHPYDARGATDVLVAEATVGGADLNTVRLLVHALRGAKGEVREVRFGREREGHRPLVNRHTPIAPLRAQI